MDKNVLKKFAIESRQELMNKIENKIKLFYIDEEFSKEQKGDIYVLSNENTTLSLSKEEYQKRELLINRVKELSLEQVIEEAAYTWFNRIIAIRYMEIHDFLPLTKDNQSLGIRVLSSKDNLPDPEILKFTNLINPDLDIEFKKEEYVQLKDDNEKFKYVLLLICKKLGKVIPQVFDGVTDYIDILIPDNLLNDAGFITKVVTEIPEDNFNQVEIIGWLYQYYNQTEKDRVISAKKAYKKNEIPYATQLFTTDWIVKYMVENSLGRYWIEHLDKAEIKTFDWNNIDFNNFTFNTETKLQKIERLKSKWKYYIDKSEQESGVQKEIDGLKKSNIKPTEITFIDPCCGSGHILVYAFEVLYDIYESAGYNKADIPELILKNNLYGLDIDDRAGQLSVLSVLLKAREYDKNIFNKEVVRNLNVMSIQESKTINENMIVGLSDENKELVQYLVNNFSNAKEIGSLLILEDKDYSELVRELEQDSSIFGITLKEMLLPLIKLAEILTKKYDVIVTNPPYMGNSSMGESLKEYLMKNYKDSKSDLCTAFMEIKLVKNNGFLAMINQHSWMFLSSFEKLREKLIKNKVIDTMIHLGTRAFEEIGGEVVQTTAFVLRKQENNGFRSTFIRLVDYDNAELKEQTYLEILESKDKKYFYNVGVENFDKIPGTPIAYWISENIKEAFSKSIPLKEIGDTRQGMATSDNNRFLRLWYEIRIDKLGFNCENSIAAVESKKKWFPYNKGGFFRKWYGNIEYIVNYENDGKEVKNYATELYRTPTRTIKSISEYFKDSVSWSKIGSGDIAFRYYPKGFVFDVAGCCIFTIDEASKYKLLGFLNSSVSNSILKVLSPTLNYEAGQIAKLPLLLEKINNMEQDIKQYVESNIELSKFDWNSFETSWDFKKHPLVKGIYELGLDNDLSEKYIEASYNEWEKECENNFNQLKANEEELNRIFINIYGLQDELTPEVADKDITIRKADREREIKSLISYAVGCMFGRYSLDEEGLIYAGGDFDINRYKTFKADIDNVIPITDEAYYFGDDIVSRFKQFIEVVYGKETLNENLDYIAETLGKKGTETSEDTIRRYFVNDFYADHIKTYQKKPIYWLFDSGKKNGFKALVYMHRYNENLVPKVRLDYLHRLQNTYEKLLADTTYKLSTELSMTDKKEAQKRQADLNAKLQETKEYDEKIAHIANQRISIDLDDGVTVNYAKFQDILAKIK